MEKYSNEKAQTKDQETKKEKLKNPHIQNMPETPIQLRKNHVQDFQTLSK